MLSDYQYNVVIVILIILLLIIVVRCKQGVCKKCEGCSCNKCKNKNKTQYLGSWVSPEYANRTPYYAPTDQYPTNREYFDKKPRSLLDLTADNKQVLRPKNAPRISKGLWSAKSSQREGYTDAVITPINTCASSCMEGCKSMSSGMTLQTFDHQNLVNYGDSKGSELPL